MRQPPKNRFKPGDTVRIKTFPMRMESGGSDTVRTWHKEATEFTVIRINCWGRYHDDINEGEEGKQYKHFIGVKHYGWFFSPDDMELVKRPKRIKSWKLEVR